MNPRTTLPLAEQSLEPRDGFRRIVVLLISLVTIPTAALLAVGIVMLTYYRESYNLLFGVLVLSFVVCLLTGSILALIFLWREAKLSELQQDFVSKVSHELRTPLTSIRIFAETLRREELPAHELEACQEGLDAEVVRLSSRIERLLDWGRMQAGKRRYELTPCSAWSLIEEAAETFERSMLGREASLELVVEDTRASGAPDPILAERGALVDALINLLSNAYKYSPDTPKKIWLSLHAEGESLRVEVRDVGIGIPRTEHRRIFQKFYRVDERLTRAQEGTGLGLSIVKHIVSGHHGKLSVESAPGTGSSFNILLPVQAAAKPQA